MATDKDGFEIGAGFAEQPPAPKSDVKPAAKPIPATSEDDDDDEFESDFERELHGEEDDDSGEEDDGEEDDGEEDDGEEDDGEEDDGEEDDGEEDDDKPKPKKKKTAKDRIRELNRRLREEQRGRQSDRAGFEARLERIEKGGLPENQGADTQENAREAPDPNDSEKYPLGSLDDRYIEDKIDYLAEKKARETVDSVLQREQKSEQSQAAQRQAQELLDTANEIAAAGVEIHDDYESVVLEAGLRGDYKLDQPTFEAAADVDHGAQILYDLATDTQEAARVASLSAYQQAKYVRDKNDEIAGTKPKPRRKPKAPAPPAKPSPKGKSAKFRTKGDTDDLDAFEKEWERQFD